MLAEADLAEAEADLEALDADLVASARAELIAALTSPEVFSACLDADDADLSATLLREEA